MAMLVGGPALYLAGETLFRLRMIGSVGPKRVTAVLALCLLGFVAGGLSALVVAVLVVVVLAALALWESDSGTLPVALRGVHRSAGAAGSAHAPRP